jgi:hypothetical protein
MLNSLILRAWECSKLSPNEKYRFTKGRSMYRTPALAAFLVAWSCIAHAQETVNGRYVNVSLPGENKTLSLAEVQVFSDGKNIAQGCVTTQTNTSSDGESNRAVDGNTSGDWGSRTITHTEGNTTNPAWEVDLIVIHKS